MLVASLFALQKEIPDWQRQVSAAKTAMDEGRYIDADYIYAGLVSSLTVSGVSDIRLAFVLAHLALARIAEGEHIEASGLLHRSVAALTADSAVRPENAAATWQVIGTCFYYQQQYAGAERAYGKALDLLQKSESSDSRAIIDLLSNLGSTYQIEHRNRDAAAAFDRAIALAENMREIPVYLRASLLNNAAVLDRSSGRHEEARTALETALHLIESSSDGDVVTIVHIQNNLALEYMEQKRYKTAVELFSEAVDRIRAGSALPRADVVQILHHYAQCQRKLDKKELPRIEAQSRAILSTYPAQQSGDRVIDATFLSK